VEESGWLLREQHVQRVKMATLVKWIDRWNIKQIRRYAHQKLQSVYHTSLKSQYMGVLWDFLEQQRRRRVVKQTLQTYRAQLADIMHSQMRQR
jgi:hypothetical protein